MKLITLNTWGGRINTELFDFLEKNQESTDVFCFQEIYNQATHIHKSQKGVDIDLTLFDSIKKILPEYQSYFRSHYLETFGLATFVKKTIPVTEEDELFVHHHKGFVPDEVAGNSARNVQRISIKQNGDDLHIFNFHGLWNGGGKRK